MESGSQTVWKFQNTSTSRRTLRLPEPASGKIETRRNITITAIRAEFYDQRGIIPEYRHPSVTWSRPDQSRSPKQGYHASGTSRDNGNLICLENTYELVDNLPTCTFYCPDLWVFFTLAPIAVHSIRDSGSAQRSCGFIRLMKTECEICSPPPAAAMCEQSVFILCRKASDTSYLLSVSLSRKLNKVKVVAGIPRNINPDLSSLKNRRWDLAHVRGLWLDFSIFWLKKIPQFFYVLCCCSSSPKLR